MCIHRVAPYRKLLGNVFLPTAERVSDEGLFLPLYPQMTDGEQRIVIAAVAAALDPTHDGLELPATCDPRQVAGST